MTPTVGPHESQYSATELAAAVDEAHAHGLAVAVHAHGGAGIADALAAGADSIEHCTFFTADGVHADPASLDALVEGETTISVTGAVLPDTQPIFPGIRERLEMVIANMASIVARGATVVVSSDAGVSPNKPHDVLPYGVASAPLLIGMTNAQALASVTSIAAAALGLADTIGTLAPGRDADILAVAGNPLEDISAIHNVMGVWARGARV